ncbi:hypothetical protein D3C72_1273130 [compost metagenome]
MACAWAPLVGGTTAARLALNFFTAANRRLSSHMIERSVSALASAINLARSAPLKSVRLPMTMLTTALALSGRRAAATLTA